MAAGAGIGPAREKVMIVTLDKWMRENGSVRPDVGGYSIINSLEAMAKQLHTGDLDDKEVRYAYRLLRFAIRELEDYFLFLDEKYGERW